ncbi:MAG: hypothetical protein HFJ40_02535 [Clostridia bacterium]|nr:hypothetical protein [Clostridia bacterium]
MLEKIGNNPLIVSIITLIVGTIIGIIGYLLKKVIDDKGKNEKIKSNNQQNNIIQNFNSGITYKEARQIAEEVVENKLNTIDKK